MVYKAKWFGEKLSGPPESHGYTMLKSNGRVGAVL